MKLRLYFLALKLSEHVFSWFQPWIFCIYRGFSASVGFLFPEAPRIQKPADKQSCGFGPSLTSWFDWMHLLVMSGGVLRSGKDVCGISGPQKDPWSVRIFLEIPDVPFWQVDPGRSNVASFRKSLRCDLDALLVPSGRSGWTPHCKFWTCGWVKPTCSKRLQASSPSCK